MTSVGKGSSAVGGRLFEAAGAELYCCWAGCGGLYELGCRGSLALVKGEGEASGAYTDGDCTDKACVDKACAGGAYMDGVYADKACASKAYIDGAACWGVGATGG